MRSEIKFQLSLVEGKICVKWLFGQTKWTLLFSTLPSLVTVWKFCIFLEDLLRLLFYYGILRLCCSCFRSKALPLINRGSYNHMHGRRRGMPYTLADIRPVSLLFTLIGHDNNIPTMQLLVESKSYISLTECLGIPI